MVLPATNTASKPLSESRSACTQLPIDIQTGVTIHDCDEFDRSTHVFEYKCPRPNTPSCPDRVDVWVEGNCHQWPTNDNWPQTVLEKLSVGALKQLISCVCKAQSLSARDNMCRVKYIVAARTCAVVDAYFSRRVQPTSSSQEAADSAHQEDERMSGP